MKIQLFLILLITVGSLSYLKAVDEEENVETQAKAYLAPRTTSSRAVCFPPYC